MLEKAVGVNYSTDQFLSAYIASAQKAICNLANEHNTAAKYDLPFTLVDFEKMVNDSEYLYKKIKHTFKEEISFEEFDSAYKKASENQKK